jgi:hypothetical protein
VPAVNCGAVQVHSELLWLNQSMFARKIRVEYEYLPAKMAGQLLHAEFHQRQRI